MYIDDEKKRIESFIESKVYSAGKKKAIVGISGGIDSAVITALSSGALEPRNVHAILMPCGEQKDFDDAIHIAKMFNVNHEVINIKDMVNSFLTLEDDVEDYKDPKKMENIKIRLGNIMARCRMICLYDRAKKHDALVIGTGNRTELLLGYVTLHGDGAVDTEPIGHLYKNEVRELAKIYHIPKRIIEKAPSAGLWDGQTDEEEFGMSYDEIEKVFKRVDNNSFKAETPEKLERI